MSSKKEKYSSYNLNNRFQTHSSNKMCVYTPRILDVPRTRFMGRTEAVLCFAPWPVCVMAPAGNNIDYSILLVVDNPIGFVNPPAPPSAKVLF